MFAFIYAIRCLNDSCRSFEPNWTHRLQPERVAIARIRIMSGDNEFTSFSTADMAPALCG